jgi:anti-sigma factor RsiW
MTYQLEQSDFDDLSAWLDGELAADRAAEVGRLVAEDPAWLAAHEELRAVDAALGDWPAPQPRADLAERVIQHCRAAGRRRQVVRVAAWLAPAAAAAAILLIVVAAMNRTTPTPPEGHVPVAEKPIEAELDHSEAFRNVPKRERAELQEVLIENLSFFSNYDVLEDFDTLEAIDRIEEQGT